MKAVVKNIICHKDCCIKLEKNAKFNLFLIFFYFWHHYKSLHVRSSPFSLRLCDYKGVWWFGQAITITLQVIANEDLSYLCYQTVFLFGLNFFLKDVFF